MEKLNDIDKDDRKTCPFNHTMVCPHQLQNKDPMWCQLCVLHQLTRQVKLLGVRQQ